MLLIFFLVFSLREVIALAGVMGMLGFLLVHSPLVSFIMELKSRLWPKKIVTLNKHGMPAYAWIQAIFVLCIIFLNHLGVQQRPVFTKSWYR